MRKINNAIHKHPLLFLFIVVLLTAAVAYFYYTFKGCYFILQDIGSDTKELYLPQYESIVNLIKSGDFSLWNLSYGFGTSVYNMNLFHPTMLLLYLLGVIFGADHIAKFLILIHIIHIVLSAFAIYLFLSSFKKLSLKSRLLASYIYSFNGYLVIWGQHYSFGLVSVLMPLVLAFIERSFAMYKEDAASDHLGAKKSQKRALILLVAVCAVCALSSYYFTYMIMLAGAIYVIMRLLIMDKKFTFKLKLLISRGALMVLGVMIGVVYMIPSYLVMSMNSSRVSSEYSAFEKFIADLILYPADYFKTLFRRFYSSTLEGNGSVVTDYTGYQNIYEDPQVFMTALFVILAIQFIIFLPKIGKTLRQRVVLILSLLIGAFLLFVESGSLIFDGFVYPFSRHTFVLLPIFALLIAYMLDFIRDNKKFSMIGAGLACGYYIAEYVLSVGDLSYNYLKVNALIMCVTAVAITIIFIIYTRNVKISSITKAAPVFICGLVIIEVVCDTYSTVYNRATLYAPSSMIEELYGEKVDAINEYLDSTDDSLYRMERTYPAGSTLMDGAAGGYYSVSCYNSTMNSNIIDFLNNVIPEMKFNDSEYRPCYRQIIGRSAFENLFGIKYLITNDPELTVEGYEEVFTSSDLRLLENEDVTFAHFYTKTITSESYLSSKDSIDTDKLISSYLIVDDDFEDADIKDEISSLPESEKSSDAGAVLNISKPSEGGHITCEAEVPTDGYVFFPMTYENGWEVTVDGEKAEMIKADYGFIAVAVSEGSHTISLDYHVPYLFECGMVSLAALGIYIIVIFMIRRKYR